MRYSFIVTTYNAESFIEKCINSIINQTYKEYECIIIDDGSIDATFVTIKELVGNDKRFHIFHQKNSGSSESLNNAIKYSKGDYIINVDHDDWVDVELLSSIDVQVELHHPDLIAFGEAYYSLDNSLIRTDLFDYCFAQGHSSVTNEAIKRISHITHSGKCIKKKLFDGLRFEGNGYGADTVVMAAVIYNSSTYVYIDKIQYFRMADPNSLSRRNQPYDVDLDFAERYIRILPLFVKDKDKTRWPIKELEGLYDHFVLFLKKDILFDNNLRKRVKNVGIIIWNNRKMCLPKRNSVIKQYLLLKHPFLVRKILL